ncbi:MAG: aminopeptidase [Lachnospiraceae bacterium]|nr:aminopeptidase [Lachnospiraceae bacterium]
MTTEFTEDMEFIKERYELARERIRMIASGSEGALSPKYDAFFTAAAGYMLQIAEAYEFVEKGGMDRATMEELTAFNHSLYAPIMPKAYETSYANPDYAHAQFGKQFDRILCVLYSEIPAMIPYAFQQDLDPMTIRMELLLQCYGIFRSAWQEDQILPDPEEIRSVLYYFVFDYSEDSIRSIIKSQVHPEGNFAVNLLKNADLTDLRYLFSYGLYVTEDEIRSARYLNALPEEIVRSMGYTLAEGYITGFAVCGKDISIKKTGEVLYWLGFERMFRYTLERLSQIGMEVTARRSPASLLDGRVVSPGGYASTSPNKQFDFDHYEDMALLLDKKLANHRNECLKSAFEAYRQDAKLHGGPLVLDIFGEEDFEPQQKEAACRFNESQQELYVSYRAKRAEITMTYIVGSERSFTIVAYPLPGIGKDYDAIFQETLKINTMDSAHYSKIQQHIVDTLDQADYVRVKGQNGNLTDLVIKLQEKPDPEKDTCFENCVADVNIPVGEVFTSPELEGTRGTLFVSHVFLNGLEYFDLKITFEDGCITDYICSNFPEEAENRKYIEDHILFHHKTLPMGEFAIGTNTTAFAMMERFGIGAKMPILIAEKTGPHFAVGDTCYVHDEDNVSYNPDGKRIFARENSFSKKRKEDPEKAYFNCHTDITIPYGELGEIVAVKADGSELPIIRNGRFVVPGTEELNIPLDEMQNS